MRGQKDIEGTEREQEGGRERGSGKEGGQWPFRLPAIRSPCCSDFSRGVGAKIQKDRSSLCSVLKAWRDGKHDSLPHRSPLASCP